MSGLNQRHPADSRSEATECLRRVAAGDAEASRRLFEIVHADLQRMAGALLRTERANHTLQPTALVNEAWIRLVDQDLSGLTDRSHFVRIAAQAMRRILLDYARKRSARAEGGDRVEVPVGIADESPQIDPNSLDWVIDLDAALNQLHAIDEFAARIVELHYFGGLTLDEVAKVLQTSPADVDRKWRFRRAWLKNELDRGNSR